MTVTQYLGTGSTSRGRMVITKQLNTLVSIPPYLRTSADKEAVIKGIQNLRDNLKMVANLTWITPQPNITSEAFVTSVSRTQNPKILVSDHTDLAACRDRFRRHPRDAAQTTGSAQPRWVSTTAAPTEPRLSIPTPRCTARTTSSLLTRPSSPDISRGTLQLPLSSHLSMRRTKSSLSRHRRRKQQHLRRP